MAEPTTLPTAEVLDLLAAIREALTVPYPGAAAAPRVREWLLADRASCVHAVINNLTRGRLLSESCGPAWWAEHLRDLTARTPITYPVAAPGEGGAS